jgi:acyl-coenzyme A thioesterase PaaI-like protein
MSKTTASATPSQTFEPEFVEALRQLFEDQIVFNRVMGLKIVEIQPERVRARIDMKPELIGHFVHGRMHGGVISACLDALGGLACMVALGARHMDEPPLQRILHFEKLGTIDLRIDYLRPAVSEHFLLHAEVLRLGSRVASTRMEFHAASGLLVATGAGAYIVS